MNTRLIEAVARSSRHVAPGEARAARRAAWLRAHPKLAAQLVRTILSSEEAARSEARRRSAR
jgi:ABC-type nitrate/sulfonate/bicarbonate transport system substrate-binding protein